MSDEVYRARRKVTADDIDAQDQAVDPLAEVRRTQQALAKETGREPPQTLSGADAPFKISGNAPPEFKAAMAQAQRQQVKSEEQFETFEAPPERPRKPTRVRPVPDRQVAANSGSDPFKAALDRLAEKHQWESFELPSKGRFYENIPATLSIRAMTGEEEQILATPRWVRKGKAIDMIFQRCIKQHIPTEELLSVDRTHLLIYLRGISYTPEYDVEIKCPNCPTKFSTVIDLNDLPVDFCPDDFDPNCLEGTLPTSGFGYRYRLATGADEQEISAYREKRIQQWGDQSEDDTLLYRTALLLEEVEGVTMKKELAMLLKRLPINDVAHLRNEINQPPFGVDTEVPMMCPSCMDEFKIDLPLETNFFFPRKKEERTQA